MMMMMAKAAKNQTIYPMKHVKNATG